MNSETGKWMIFIGAVILCLGVIVFFFHEKLNWIGRLPGDIRIEKENFKFYFPITTMILVSIIFILVTQIIRKWL